MKKALSILLTIAMCMGLLVAIVPTVSATEPDPTPSGAVYYEENFNAPSLASLVDSVIIMCCPDRTHFKPIQHASRTLAESGATVIGIVVNDVEMGSGNAFAPAGHSYGYSYGYGGYRAYGAYRPYGPLKSKEDGDKTGESKSTAKGEDKGKDEADSEKRVHKPRPEIADDDAVVKS